MNKQNNYDINRNIRFFINLYLYLLQFNMATSKTWTQTLKNLDPEKHGSQKTWNIYEITKLCLTLELCFNQIYISTHKI